MHELSYHLKLIQTLYQHRLALRWFQSLALSYSYR